MRKILSALLVLTMLLGITAGIASADEQFFYRTTKQRDNLYLIGEEATPLFEDGDRLPYWESITLVIGTEKAAVIDTGFGAGDLIGHIRKFTDLPLVLILTHGDGDHIGGAWQFQDKYDIYMNSADYEMTLKSQERSGHHFEITHDLQDGDIIDLGGGTVLEAINLKGHTDGSMVLWDRQNNSLYTGDAINRRPWVFLERSVPLEGYLEDMIRVFKMTEDYQPTIYCNHDVMPFPYRVVTDTIQACSEVLLGKADGIPYRSPLAEEGELYENSYEYTVGMVRLCYNINDLWYEK